MTIFRTQIFKIFGTERPWTNVYHINAASLADAADAARIQIAAAEASMLNVGAEIVKILTSNPADHTFIHDATSIAGENATSSLLPLFCTMKVNVSVAGFGRVDYKFYRGFLDETNTEDFLIDGATITAVEGIINGLISDMTAASTPLVDNVGNLWQVASVQSAVQDRQRHRRRKKKVLL